ncbi:MAG: hypothetical protein OXG04_04000 [Acidobacteria bacterium]|nr:hypothetical protein [Acidobacteriota bacterium]
MTNPVTALYERIELENAAKEEVRFPLMLRRIDTPVPERVAYRRGLTRVVLPRQNGKHFERDVGDDVRPRVVVHYVRRVDDLLDLVLFPAEAAGERARIAADAALAVRR